MTDTKQTKNKKPAKSHHKKVFDVVPPGKAAAVPNSRSVIPGVKKPVADDQFVPGAPRLLASDPNEKRPLMTRKKSTKVNPLASADTKESASPASTGDKFSLPADTEKRTDKKPDAVSQKQGAPVQNAEQKSDRDKSNTDAPGSGALGSGKPSVKPVEDAVDNLQGAPTLGLLQPIKGGENIQKTSASSISAEVDTVANTEGPLTADIGEGLAPLPVSSNRPRSSETYAQEEVSAGQLAVEQVVQADEVTGAPGLAEGWTHNLKTLEPSESSSPLYAQDPSETVTGSGVSNATSTNADTPNSGVSNRSAKTLDELLAETDAPMLDSDQDQHFPNKIAGHSRTHQSSPYTKMPDAKAYVAHHRKADAKHGSGVLSAIFLFFGVILLAAAVLNTLLDAEIIKTDLNLPYTDLF